MKKTQQQLCINFVYLIFSCILSYVRGSVRCQLLQLVLAFISQSRNDIETWFLHQTREQALAKQTNPLEPHYSIHTCAQATLFPYPITMPLIKHRYQLSTAHIFSFYKLLTSSTILDYQLEGSLIPPCLLYHTVTLTPTQHYTRGELDKYNHDPTSHTVTEIVQTTVLNDQTFNS